MTDPWHWNAGFFGYETTVLYNMTQGPTFFFRQYNANTLLLHAGINDATIQDVTPAVAAANIVAIAQQFLADKPAGKAFVMLTLFGGSALTSTNAYVSTMRPLISSGLSGVARAFVVNPPMLLDSEYQGGAAGLHPLDIGYQKMADDGLGNGWIPAMQAQGY